MISSPVFRPWFGRLSVLPVDELTVVRWPAAEAPTVEDRSMLPGVLTSDASMQVRTVLLRTLTAMAAPTAGLTTTPGVTDAATATAKPPASARIVERSRAVRLT